MSGAAAIKELERAGWDARAETYGRLTGQITTRVVEPLLDAAGVAAGTRVLDVGTGPGYAAAAAAERGAAVTGIDIAEAVLARARDRHRGVRFVRADAEELPFADASFDAVVGNFAINHLPRPERAVREFERVLAVGGWVALSSWDGPERSGFPGLLATALADAGVAAPKRFRFADDDEFGALLRGAGLADVEISTLSLTHRVPDAYELWHGMLGGSVRSAGLVLDQPRPVRARVRAAFERLAEEYRDDGALALPVRAKVARGRRT